MFFVFLSLAILLYCGPHQLTLPSEMAPSVPSTHHSLLALLNHPDDKEHSHIVTLELNCKLSEISVCRILSAAKLKFSSNVVRTASNLNLRWITDEVNICPIEEARR